MVAIEGGYILSLRVYIRNVRKSQNSRGSALGVLTRG
jgi:hypothetical protein